MQKWLPKILIIKGLLFTMQQNIVQLGHEESRDHIERVSGFNCGIYFDLLHIRCKDIPWFREMLQSKIHCHTQWEASRYNMRCYRYCPNLYLSKFV